MMGDRLKRQKLTMWKKKLESLEEEYSIMLQKKGEVASLGDLRENAAFQMLEEDIYTYRARIEGVRKIISDLEGKH